MTTPDIDTATNSDNKATANNLQQNDSSIDNNQSQEPNQHLEGYFNSETSLRSKINELTRIAESGDQEEVAKAMDELTHIENVLSSAKDDKSSSLNKSSDLKPSDEMIDETSDTTGKNQTDNGVPKKFSVYWQGQKIDREDHNNLLGYKNTGEIKAALIKAQLQLQHNDSQNAALMNQLRGATEKIKSFSQSVPQSIQTPVSTQRNAQSNVIFAPLAKPIPPMRPILSTNDPSLYTEEDIMKMDEYTKSSHDFFNRIVDYVANVELRARSSADPYKNELVDIKNKLSQFDEEREILKKERQRLQDEKADNDHWKQFDIFQNKHKTFKTSVPVKQLNEVMNKWMDNVAEANGVHKSSDGSNIADYFNQRANVITRYLNNDSQTLQNAQGINPPEDYQTFFRLLELYHQLNKYRDSTILGSNATLHDAYLRMKDDAGELDDDLNTVRLNERTNAVEQFTSGVQQLQNHAVNIDPKQSAGGPDVNELGISTNDLKWFKSITPDRLHDYKYRNAELYNKWNAIADKIVQYSR
jgi:hypothetical protein